MAGRPFGADETGRPVGRTKGPVIRATIGCMLACVEQRVAAIDPASVDQARTSALAELVARLNSAILDPRYHVTADYLMDEGHSYSVEFDTFLGHICRELSGDPAFHFNRGARGIPGLVVLLARPFSLSQVYHRLPGFAAKLADVDLRVVTVTPTSAVIRWHGDRDIARLPQGLHQLFIEMDCQYMQGALAAIPRLHSGQPMATVRELQCQLRGDPCCEWEISWINPPDAHHVPTLEGVAVTRSLKAHPAGSHKAGRVIGLAAGSQPDEQFYPVPVVLPDSALPPLPPFIEGLPYGADQDGRPIRQITGTGLIGAIREMQDQIGQQVGRELPAAMDPEERLAQINQAQLAALDRLVERLNVVIPDPRYHVTPDYLLNESNYYSHEFNLYLNEFAREITGDPSFHFHRGRRSIPPTILTLARPLSIRQIYALLPRFTARVTEAEFHVISTTSASAVIQWRPARQLAHLPPTLHRRYCHMACQAYQGVFAAIPWEHSRLPLARIQERRCLMQGDDCCEWEFSWELAPSWRSCRAGNG